MKITKINFIMKRTLILIANTGTPDNPAYGARKDIDDYRNFFRSDEGGAWEENEILTFYSTDEEPLTKTFLLDTILECQKNGTEYFLIVFCGHGGATSKGESFFELSPDEICELGTLKAILYPFKYTLIADSCRSIELLKEGGRMPAIHTFSQVVSDSPYRKLCRDCYNRIIAESSSSAYTICYAAALDETAQDLGRTHGGWFSQTLLNTVSQRIPMLRQRVSDKGSFCKYVKLSACVSDIADAMAQKSGNNQHPQCECKGGVDELPFIVCPNWQLQL